MADLAPQLEEAAAGGPVEQRGCGPLSQTRRVRPSALLGPALSWVVTRWNIPRQTALTEPRLCADFGDRQFVLFSVSRQG